MRLIDANAIPWCNYDLDGHHYFVGVDKEYVDEIPTIDPESLRPKGRWEEVYEEEDGTVHYRCTNCGQIALEKRLPGVQIGVTHAKFCLECGAKMEG